MMAMESLKPHGCADCPHRFRDSWGANWCKKEDENLVTVREGQRFPPEGCPMKFDEGV
jgi:hypothetical protein